MEINITLRYDEVLCLKVTFSHVTRKVPVSPEL